MPSFPPAGALAKLTRLGGALLVPLLIGQACQPGFRRTAPPVPVVTVAEATRVATEKLQLLDRYNQTGDIIFLENTISGPARLVDRTFIEERLFFKQPLQRKARPIRKLTAFVPRQSGYPAYFLVLRETTDVDNDGNVTPEPAYYIDLYARPNGAQAWTVVLYVRATGPELVGGLSTDREGYVAQGRPEAGREVLDGYMRYLNTYVRDGHPDEAPGLAAGSFTSNVASAFRTSQDHFRQQGIDMGLQFSSAPQSDAYAFTSTAGSTLVVGALQGFLTATGRGCLPQPPDRSLWGWLVPPGRYGSIGVRVLLMFLAEVPKAPASSGAATRITAAVGPVFVGATFPPCPAPPGA